MKVTQGDNGTAGVVSTVAGNCTIGAPVNGQPAINTGFTSNIDGFASVKMAVWDNGNAIYYQVYNQSSARKIINGIAYSLAMSFGSEAHIAYHAVGHRLIVTRGTIRAYVPHLGGDGGEVEDVSYSIPGTSASDGCGDDGALAENSCFNARFSFVTPAGKIFFTDGGTAAYVMLRYFDDENRLQTLVGSLSYSGNGLSPSLTKGAFGGIYYKKASEPLGANHQYPEGLYFIEFRGGVFGYFSEAQNKSVNLWGNQSANTPPTTTGSAIGTGYSLGPSTNSGYGDLKAMTFDKYGRPWIRYHTHRLVTLDENRQTILRHSTLTESHWHNLLAGSDPRTTRFYTYGMYQNITLLDNKLFLLGVRYDVDDGWTDRNPKIKVFDYDDNVVHHVMGTDNSALAPEHTPEQVAEGSLQDKLLPSNCQNSSCSVQYVEDQNRLYFSEGPRLRYITRPLEPNHHTLRDVFVATTGISNFILSEDRKYIFYILSGALYCHAMNVVDESAICKNDPAQHINLGPPAGMDTISKGPNQMTWKNNSILFISTQKGEIYQYNVYH